MTKASDNPYPSILITEGTEPTAPAAGKQRLYIDSTSHKLKRTDSSGTDVTIEGITNPMTTAGDVIYGGASGTPTRLASAGVTTKFLRGANAAAPSWEFPPGYEFDYAQATSGVAPTATSEATANTVVTGNAVTYDGSTAIWVEFFTPAARPDSTAGRTMTFALYDGSSSVGLMGTITMAASTGDTKTILLRYRLTPSAAAHTYSIRAYVSAGTGSISGQAGGSGLFVPLYIRQTKA